MRNRYAGYCYYCTKHVAKNEGHFEKRQNQKGFRLIHAECVFKNRKDKEIKMNRPLLATHYSRSLDKYFSFDNAVFIWENNDWREVFDIIQVGDLEEL